jgi:hypothetical protein
VSGNLTPSDLSSAVSDGVQRADAAAARGERTRMALDKAHRSWSTKRWIVMIFVEPLRILLLFVIVGTVFAALGATGIGEGLVALGLLLCVGIFIRMVWNFFLHLLPGSTRSGQHQPLPAVSAPTAGSDTRPCPRCAETIKVAAKACRFCGLDLTAPYSA